MKTSSFTAGGLATGTMESMSISIKGMNRTASAARKSSGSGKKKRLNYRPQELSSAILRASKSQSARRVTVQARNKLSNLMKCKKTGQYDEGELNTAIVHAKRMVRCAQMKARNLSREEQDNKQYESEVKTEERQRTSEVKTRAARKEQNLEQKEKIEQVQRVQRQKSQKRELLRRKKAHRNAEQNKISQADMDYFRRQLRNIRESGSENIKSGVSLDLSMEAMQMSELQMEQQAQRQTEQETERQIELQMAVGNGNEGAGISGADIAASAGGNMYGGVAAASIDISI